MSGYDSSLTIELGVKEILGGLLNSSFHIGYEKGIEAQRGGRILRWLGALGHTEERRSD